LEGKISNAVESLKSELASYGLLLCDLKSVSSLPSSVWLEPCTHVEGSEEMGFTELMPQHVKSGSLLLVGHAGKKFWEVFGQSEFWLNTPDADPVDNYSIEVTRLVIKKHLPDITKQRLFPSADCPVNLMALGRAFGWHEPSPLGMGIHEQYGLWSAYRAVWWLDLEIAESVETKHELSDIKNMNPTSKVESADICSQCLTQDCVSECPSNAIEYLKNPDLGRCADYRLEEASQCASTCLSRMACPYASEHRYAEKQMSYHYELARSSIARYRNQS